MVLKILLGTLSSMMSSDLVRDQSSEPYSIQYRHTQYYIYSLRTVVARVQAAKLRSKPAQGEKQSSSKAYMVHCSRDGGVPKVRMLICDVKGITTWHPELLLLFSRAK